MSTKFFNVRGGTIRLSSDAPVYFGVGLEVEDGIANKLINSPLVKGYLESGSLVYIKGKNQNGSKLGLKKFAEIYGSPKSETKEPSKPKPKAKDGDGL